MWSPTGIRFRQNGAAEATPNATTSTTVAFESFGATEPEDSAAPRADADAALHRAETLIAQGDSERAIGFLRAAKSRCAATTHAHEAIHQSLFPNEEPWGQRMSGVAACACASEKCSPTATNPE